jgi:hypothetical protein
MMARWRMTVAGVLVLQVFCSCLTPVPVFAAGASSDWFPNVSIIWPHDSSGVPTNVAASSEVNVSVWPTNIVSCTQNPGLSLWIAYNNDPAGPLSPDVQGHMVSRRVTDSIFPSLEFNDVPLNLAANPTARFTIMAGYGTGQFSNVWVHALDSRTYFPDPVVPTGYGTPIIGRMDSRIQIVFPHDSQGRQMPVAQANFVNIAVDIFVHGSLQSVPPDYEPDAFYLKAAVGNDLLSQLSPTIAPVKTTYAVSGQFYPRWVFNDIPVQPGQQYHFAAYVFKNKLPSPYSNVWTHAADARTILPNPSPPPSCVS